MTYDDDELDLLLQRMPAPGVPADVRERHLTLLRDTMAAEQAPAPAAPVGRILRRRHSAHGSMSRRRRVVVAVVGAVVLVVGVTAAATIWQRAGERTMVHCYPKLTTDFYQPGLGPDAMNIGGDGDTASLAIDICASFWAGGTLTSQSPYTEPKGSTPVPTTAPPLIACVLPDGVVGVFPVDKGQTCGSLGLPSSEG